MSSKHTVDELRYKQSLPLEIKVEMTKRRIREWVQEFSVDGVYVSFSGGKDSTVLLHIAREIYPNMLAVFCDTGLEYPEIREFVRTIDNVEWLKPKMNFKKVIETYGYPFISKEVSSKVGGGQKALQILKDDGVDITNRSEVVAECAKRLKKEPGEWRNLAQCFSAITKDNVIKENLTDEEKGAYSEIPKKYKFLIDAPFKLSAKCCNEMKKKPMHQYCSKTKRYPITATMASESRSRTQAWLQNGCNTFEGFYPISNPMAFWTEQDVLKYIKDNDIAIASVYGDVVYADNKGNYYDNVLNKDGVKLCTTMLNRTGCMFCGYGCHRETQGRFVEMKQTHPKLYDYIMKPTSKGGLGYKEVIDWINENGNIKISY